MPNADKKKLRELVLNKRNALDSGLKKAWDEKIFKKLINSKLYQDARVIFTFVSFGSEVDTHQIINYALKDEKIICVPKIPSPKQGIAVYRINSFDDLREGYYHILEPVDGCSEVSPADIDLILMPGLAFDRSGGRVGYGGGYYDRFLAQLTNKVNKIALAYDFQVFAQVPTDEKDVKIDGIITPSFAW